MDSDSVREGHSLTRHGGALAAVLAAGIGAFAMGVFVILNEAGIFTAPSLYGPSGGLSGRAALAVVVWLIAWGILHAKWRDRDVVAGSVLIWALVLVGLGVVLTFPPVWSLL